MIFKTHVGRLLVGGHALDPIAEQARYLLDKIAAVRKEDTPVKKFYVADRLWRERWLTKQYQEEDRAVVFVAYDFGAAVVKKVGRPYPFLFAFSAQGNKY